MVDGENVAEMEEGTQAGNEKQSENVTTMLTVSAQADHAIGKGSLISIPDTS